MKSNEEGIWNDYILRGEKAKQDGKNNKESQQGRGMFWNPVVIKHFEIK